MTRLRFAALILLAALWSGDARAQSVRPAVEGGLGGAWFIDEGAIGHMAADAGVRWSLTRRLSVGPEITYMIGPGSDRDLFVTGNIIFDLRRAGVTPYLIGGAGLFRHSDRFFGRTFSSTEGGTTAGFGVRFPLRTGWYIAPEARIGWEPHTRLQVTVGYRKP